MSKDSPVIEAAKVFALYAHEGQFRDGGEPYIIHPRQTADILSLLTDDEDIIAAGWLHDVLEDTEYTYDVLAHLFDAHIANLVNEVTHETTEDGEHYFPRLKSQEAIMIKLADRLSNVSDMTAWNDGRKKRYLARTKFWKSDAIGSSPRKKEHTFSDSVAEVRQVRLHREAAQNEEKRREKLFRDIHTIIADPYLPQYINVMAGRICDYIYDNFDYKKGARDS